MLSGKVALITGSTSGIGLATAHVFAAEGVNIILHGLMPTSEGQALAQKFAKDYQVNVVFDNADLSDPEAITAMVASATEQLGSIDILVNNAGIQHTDSVVNFAKQKWDDILAVNLTAAFHLMQATLPKMQENHWGRVINVASVHGLVASANKAAYCAAKHGLVGLTKVAAIECAEQGVTVNAVCPGWVNTPLIKSQINTIAEQKGISFEQASYDLVTAKQPLPEMMDPIQIGEFILFLCRDSARSITGAALPMDGAWTAQ
ncbi:3-hydroxybutyrate dehydrogenase [Thalassotalea maritima]|uniref:3-hydroxybutyrate dehydrogenase n=1 Tax=Thalassotalea maritima TaxID=3242416 RepID=UPI0035274846